MCRAATIALILTLGGDVLAQAGRAVPPLDTTKHSVPLGEVCFDTFDQNTGAVRLTDATPELIDRLRDAIPPLHQPRYERADDVRWLEDDDLVIGYAGAHGAWAYPVRILTFHEIVNEVLEGIPVLVSYCPLCASGVVFSRHVGTRVLSFGNTSALHEADLMMLDYQTGSYWWLVAPSSVRSLTRRSTSCRRRPPAGSPGSDSTRTRWCSHAPPAIAETTTATRSAGTPTS